jgi:tRNA(adenine34) deaminase
MAETVFPLFKDLDLQEKDRFFMKAALKEAQKAFDEDEVPVGAVLVVKDKIVARGYNQVERLKDATAHAEMLCVTSASEHLGNWRLNDATLYCTLEPCLMCAGALLSSRVTRLVWGAKDQRVGANGSWIDVFSTPHPIHSIEVQGGVLEEESAALLQEFFKKVRKKNAKK